MSAASPGLEPKDLFARTVALWSPALSASSAGGCSGTGFWLGGDLVLTANHCVPNDDLDYRWAGATAWTPGGAIVARDAELDFAVVRVARQVSSPEPKIAAWLQRPEIQTDAAVMGFPSFQQKDNNLRLRDVGGPCRPFTGHEDGTLEVLTGAHDNIQPEQWKGISGAGVLLDGALAGIVLTASDVGLQARTLVCLRDAQSPVWAAIQHLVMPHQSSVALPPEPRLSPDSDSDPNLPPAPALQNDRSALAISQQPPASSVEDGALGAEDASPDDFIMKRLIYVALVLAGLVFLVGVPFFAPNHTGKAYRSKTNATYTRRINTIDFDQKRVAEEVANTFCRQRYFFNLVPYSGGAVWWDPPSSASSHFALNDRAGTRTFMYRDNPCNGDSCRIVWLLTCRFF